MQICEMLKERDYGFNIWAYARIDTVREKYLNALKDAGVDWLGLGVESANKNVPLTTINSNIDTAFSNVGVFIVYSLIISFCSSYF